MTSRQKPRASAVWRAQGVIALVMLANSCTSAASTHSDELTQSQSVAATWGGYADQNSAYKTRQDDRFAAKVTALGTLYVVADGVSTEGGYEAAERFTREIVSIGSSWQPGEDPASAFHGAVDSAAQRVEASLRRERISSSTTGVIALVDATNTMHLAHRGDSPAFRFDRRTSQLAALTADHGYGNVITAFFGWHPMFQSDPTTFTRIAAVPGDLLLLATDGVTKFLTQERIQTFMTALAQEESSETHPATNEDGMLSREAEVLVKLALSAGSNDNATALFGRLPAGTAGGTRDDCASDTSTDTESGARNLTIELMDLAKGAWAANYGSGTSEELYKSATEIDGYPFFEDRCVVWQFTKYNGTHGKLVSISTATSDCRRDRDCADATLDAMLRLYIPPPSAVILSGSIVYNQCARGGHFLYQ